MNDNKAFPVTTIMLFKGSKIDSMIFIYPLFFHPVSRQVVHKSQVQEEAKKPCLSFSDLEIKSVACFFDNQILFFPSALIS